MTSRNKRKRNEKSQKHSDEETDDLDYEEDAPENEDDGVIEILVNLCKLCRYIHKLHNIGEQRKQKWNRRNPIISTVENYLKILNVALSQKNDNASDDCADIIIDDLLFLYKDHRENLINHSEDWLIKTSLMGEIISNNTKLHFNTRNLLRKKSSKRNINNEPAIYLSIFYKQAVDLFEKHKDDKIAEGTVNKYTVLPFRFQRLYYLAFEQAINLDERGKYIDDSIIIGDILDSIYTNLGINDGTYEEDFSFTGLTGIFGNISDNFKVILNKVITSARNNGIDIPDIDNMDSIINLFMGLVTGENSLKNLAGTLFDDLDSDDPLEYVDNFLNKISDPEIINKITEATGIEFTLDDVEGTLKNDAIGRLLINIADIRREATELDSEVDWES